MLHQAYIADWERQEFSAFGKQLVPMTLGHARVLYVADSPLVTGASAPSVEEILFAVVVCSLPKPPDRKSLHLISVEDPLKFGAFPLEDELKKFRDYYRYYMKPIPRFLEKQEARAPWPWVLVARLMSECHYAEEQAWSEVVSKAFWLCACLSIAAGDKTYPSIEEQEIVEFMEQDDG